MARQGLLLSKTQKKRFIPSWGRFSMEQAVYVPSTRGHNVPVPKRIFEKRVEETGRFMDKTFGGHTTMIGAGGYLDTEKHRYIREKVARVVAFTTPKQYYHTKTEFRANHRRLLIPKGKAMMFQLSRWDKRWGQQTMGYELQGKMFYVEKGLKPKVKRRLM